MATIIKGKNPRKPYTVRSWVDGKQRERSFATRKEATDYRIKVEHDARLHIFVEPDQRTTLDEFARTWLKQHAMAEASRHAYTSAYENHVSPALGSKPLAKISREAVRTLLLEQMPATVGPATVRQAYKLLRAVLGEAQRQGKIVSNPAARIRLPGGSRGTKRAEFTFATPAQLDIIAAALPERWRAAVWIMRGCGLRPGEALALKADSVRGRNLRTEEQVNQRGGLTPLKARTAGEYRDVPAPAYVRDVITEHCRRYGLSGSDYLFPDFTEGRSWASDFRDRFRKGARAAGLPDSFVPHSLRHTFASVALAQGVPISDVSRWLGHRDINITVNTYGHLLPDATDRAVAALDAEYATWRASGADQAA